MLAMPRLSVPVPTVAADEVSVPPEIVSEPGPRAGAPTPETPAGTSVVPPWVRNAFSEGFVGATPPNQLLPTSQLPVDPVHVLSACAVAPATSGAARMQTVRTRARCARRRYDDPNARANLRVMLASIRDYALSRIESLTAGVGERAFRLIEPRAHRPCLCRLSHPIRRCSLGCPTDRLERPVCRN